MRFAIVQLDREYILSELLPALAKQYFGGSAASRDLEYEVTIVRNRVPHTIVYASLPTRDGSFPATADATAPLLGIRSATASHQVTTTTESAAVRSGGEALPVISGVIAGFEATVPESWQLRVTHRTGSLAALAAQTRRQNLIASSTILALLAGSLVLMLVALQRNRALTRQQMEFVAGISHELRTPIAVVCMTGANLADGLVSDPEQVRRYGRIIQRDGRRLTEMTEQVLSFARIESASLPAPEPVTVATLIHRAIEPMQPQIDEKAFACTVVLPESLPPLLVDPASIERAIQNLISNALKYSAASREIRSTAGTEELRGSTHVWIAVEDHGIGIYPDELSLIFEPFRRGRAALERNLPGTGLGLSLVRRIVQAHGGAVHVRSEPRAGSTFTLYLPAARELPSATPASP
jgi:two-component system sensor histidine kinase SenX3